MVFIFAKRMLINSIELTEFYQISLQDNEVYRVEISDFNIDGETVVSFDVFNIIETLRAAKSELRAVLIDIAQIFKLNQGKPSSESKYNNPFTFDKILHYFDLLPKDKISIIAHRETISFKDLSNAVISDILIGLREAYNKLIEMLNNQGEYKRFFYLELPICQILYNREIFGISISPDIFEDRLNKLDEIENNCKYKLRYQYKIADVKDLDSISLALKKDKFDFIAKNIAKNSFDHILKYGSETNELLSLIYNLRKSKRDKSFMLRFGAIGSERIYPTFDCIGTITSRILVKEPLIQQLRVSSRDIFIPDSDKLFVYADYGQFEPGILADKAGDTNLIDLYNKGDVYEGLSIAIFSTVEYRKISKILFLSFMYGMSIESLSLVINELYPLKVHNIPEKLRLFFSKFNSLIPFKSELESELLSNNRIGTSEGNYRYRDCISPSLKNKERRWLLSQKVQGSASLILKKAIISLSVYKQIEFLIPMHDAVLFQVPKNEFELCKDLIKEAFEESFRIECPSIIPKVNFEQFAK
jgi:DNA polymerase I